MLCWRRWQCGCAGGAGVNVGALVTAHIRHCLAWRLYDTIIMGTMMPRVNKMEVRIMTMHEYNYGYAKGQAELLNKQYVDAALRHLATVKDMLLEKPADLTSVYYELGEVEAAVNKMCK